MSKKKTFTQHLGKEIADYNIVEAELKKANSILDDIGIPKWDSEGKKIPLHIRLDRHREQIEDHLFKLRGLLERYRR